VLWAKELNSSGEEGSTGKCVCVGGCSVLAPPGYVVAYPKETDSREQGLDIISRRKAERSMALLSQRRWRRQRTRI
jgi:hypothetical protein